MKQRILGGTDLSVSELGYGAMVLIGLYGDVDERQGIRVIRHALDRGVNLIDTADAYGANGSNERLVGRAIEGRRDQVVLATKFGIAPAGSEHAHRVRASYDNEIWIDARPERVREAADQSLARLGVEAIDLYYLHFPDPGLPIEETVGAMAELVAAGKVRHLGLSNVTGDQLSRAAAVHPIAAGSGRVLAVDAERRERRPPGRPRARRRARRLGPPRNGFPRRRARARAGRLPP